MTIWLKIKHKWDPEMLKGVNKLRLTSFLELLSCISGVTIEEESWSSEYLLWVRICLKFIFEIKYFLSFRNIKKIFGYAENAEELQKSPLQKI